MFGHSSKCQICGSIDLQVILKYGHQCPVHGHRTKDQLNEEEDKSLKDIAGKRRAIAARRKGRGSLSYTAPGGLKTKLGE